MDITQKIADLIAKAKRSMWGKSGLSSDLARNTYIAEYLIANGVTVLDEPIKMVIPEGIDEQALMKMIRNAPVQILPCEPVQEWISVKDRLPEENERVLACYINPLRKDRPPRMMVGEGTSTQIVKGKVYLWCGGWRSITHWMPLPEPPKGE